MSEAFEAAIRAMLAWQQLGLLLGGLLLLTIAGFLLAWLAHLRLTGRRVRACLVAVRMTERRERNGKARQPGEMYYPIFDYRSNGDTIRAEGNGGSSWLLNKLPGTEIDGHVQGDDPETVHRPGLSTLIVALLLGVVGVGLLRWAFTTYEFNPFTVVIGLAFAVWAGVKIAGTIKPRREWDTKESFRQRRAERRRKKRSEGRLLTDDEIRERVKVVARQQRRWMPVLALLGVALIGLGGYLARDMRGFVAGGGLLIGALLLWAAWRYRAAVQRAEVF